MAKQLKESLRSRRLVRVAYLGQLCNPKMVEILALGGGYDAVWFDQEHTGVSIVDVENCCRAARSCGLDTFVRLAPTDYATVMRPLEAGAGGIMAAQVRNASQTEDIVRWAKFHPRGCRGVNGTGVDGQFGTTPILEYMKAVNAETFVAIQIENAEAVEDVERIAAVPDVDVLFVGPADLSQSLGIPGEWDHPRLWEAIGRVAAAARASGTNWAILPASVAIARRCVEMGCRMLSVGIDVSAVVRGWRSYRDEYREFF